MGIQLHILFIVLKAVIILCREERDSIDSTQYNPSPTSLYQSNDNTHTIKIEDVSDNEGEDKTNSYPPPNRKNYYSNKNRPTSDSSGETSISIEDEGKKTPVIHTEDKMRLNRFKGKHQSTTSDKNKHATSSSNYKPKLANIPSTIDTQSTSTNLNDNNDKTQLSPSDIESLLGSKVYFDGDNSDIDKFNFGLDELDEEHEIDINDNHISPYDWQVILENYINVLSKGKQDTKNKNKINKANKLKLLEYELIERGTDDFNDEEENKLICANLEYDILNQISDLPIDTQKIVFDVDKDGLADFDFIILKDHSSSNES